MAGEGGEVMASDIEFGVILEHADGSKPAKTMHIMTTHRTSPDDKSPLEIISADRLAELERIEAGYNAECSSKSNSSAIAASASPTATLPATPEPMAKSDSPCAPAPTS